MSVKAEIDARHASSRAAQESRDADAYLDQCHRDLVYVDSQGRHLDLARLRAETRRAFKIYSSFQSSFEREAFEETEAGATETITQYVRGTLKGFLVVRRDVTIVRRSRLEWVRCEDGLFRILRAHVLEQTVKSGVRLSSPFAE